MLSIVAAACILNSKASERLPSYERIEAEAWQDAAKAAADADKKHLDDIAADKEMGKKYAAQADKDYKASDDAVATARVQKIGALVAGIANSTPMVALWGDSRPNKFDYTFKLVKGKDVNAFSLPGGYIYVFEGLVKYVETDDELAGVLAHEVSHAKFRHIATLQREQSKLQNVSLPVILLAILTGGVSSAGVALEAGGLVSQAVGSGWSVKAETAADFGGLQILEHSNYDPTGMLTVMERLACDERSRPDYQDLGIFRSHPPSRERAEALTKRIHDAGLEIRRSNVTTSYRTTAKPNPNGGVDILFGKRPIATFGGASAAARAQTAVERLNEFFDSTPELFEVAVSDDGWIYGRQKPLLKLTQDDADLTKSSLKGLQTNTVSNLKRCLYYLLYRIWDAG